jgi:hypothetical protein
MSGISPSVECQVFPPVWDASTVRELKLYGTRSSGVRQYGPLRGGHLHRRYPSTLVTIFLS